MRYFRPLKSSGAVDRLLEPAERLGRHRHGEEADDVELHDSCVELVDRAPCRRRYRSSRALLALKPNTGPVPNSEAALCLPYQ